MKEITPEELGLTAKEIKELVSGSQRFIPARDEEGNLLDVTPETAVDGPAES